MHDMDVKKQQCSADETHCLLALRSSRETERKLWTGVFYLKMTVFMIHVTGKILPATSSPADLL